MTGPLANAARGEVVLLNDGAPQRLCLTLGALADLEAAFDAANLQGLAERLSGLGPSDLLTVLAALCAGGGKPMLASELARAEIDPRAAAKAVAEAFKRAFDDTP
jgi:hypothetical protein